MVTFPSCFYLLASSTCSITLRHGCSCFYRFSTIFQYLFHFLYHFPIFSIPFSNIFHFSIPLSIGFPISINIFYTMSIYLWATLAAPRRRSCVRRDAFSSASAWFFKNQDHGDLKQEKKSVKIINNG